MPRPDPAVQIRRVETLEGQLEQARLMAGRALRQRRLDLKLSLRQLRVHVGLSIAALSNLERGVSWETSTAFKVARALEKVA